jgi:HEAT repeat protein
MALGAIGPEARSQIPELIEALRDKELLVVASASTALGQLGEAAERALPLLAQLARHEDKGVQQAANDAIDKIRNPKKERP